VTWAIAFKGSAFSLSGEGRERLEKAVEPCLHIQDEVQKKVVMFAYDRGLVVTNLDELPPDGGTVFLYATVGNPPVLVASKHHVTDLYCRDMMRHSCVRDEIASSKLAARSLNDKDRQTANERIEQLVRVGDGSGAA
jgi:hypothetical protein